MKPEERENLRKAILNVLDANATQLGLSQGAIRVLIVQFGLRLEPEAIAPELLYLADKGLVVNAAKSLSPENRWWRITAEGRDFVAQN